MPPRYYAAVTCPACGSRFQTPVEQILDVRVDPEVKGRVMGGMVNMSVCPSCGMGGPLNLPFIYHDPEKDVALLYLPMGIGNSEVERQKAAGTLTRQLMNAMPMEERKGYLLQPETFINIETLVKRVLELEGVTDDDLDHSRRQRELLTQLITAPADQREALLADNVALMDEAFFSLMQYTLQMAAMGGPESADFKQFRDVYEYVVEHTETGQLLQKRTEVIGAFAENPSRESLLQALVDAPDDTTVTALVQSGLNFMDYAFFQRIVRRIDAAETPEEKERLSALRRLILDIREELSQASQAVMGERAELLQKMLGTDNPLVMARSHLSELDDTFAYVLRTELEEARQQGNQQMLDALQKIARVLSQVMEENMPPEVVLARRLLMSPSEEQTRQLLEQNKGLLGAGFFQLLDNLEASTQQEGNADAAAQLAQIRQIALQYASQEAAPPAPTSTPQPRPQPPASSETQTPSGLIIAKH